MIESSVEEKIDQALRGRLEQQPFVDRLVGAWTELSRGFAELLTAAEDVGRSPGGPSSPEGEARAAIAAMLAGGGDGASPTRRLADRIRNVERLLDAVRARTQRSTVNIGVIGSTKVGKSTLLSTITGLPDTVIPTTPFNPTTASASRIYHTLDRPTAVLTLHTWDTFRDTYLAPLHQKAKLGTPPRRPADFWSYTYPAAGSVAAGAASADDFLRRLAVAQSSFGSYEQLLTDSRRTLEVGFDNLRPYVAYPDDENGDPDDHRPYHAVRDVRIEHRFPDVTATKVGLVDLPGAGEAGLDIDEQFVQRVKNEIDYLLMVKRGVPTAATHLAEDSYALALADSARGGAALEDFYAVVVNKDQKHDPQGTFFANTRDKVHKVAQERRIDVFAADVIRREDVTANLLRPVFDHLAATLATMDRANIEAVLTEAGQTAAEVARFAETVAAEAGHQLRALPNQKHEIRRLARDLLGNVGLSLEALREHYDELVRSGDADEPLTRGIGRAVRAATDWLETGLGTGSTDAWFTFIKRQWVRGQREATQDEYYRVRTQITRYFSDVDDSLDESIQDLWNRVADILRQHLTPQLVPATTTGEEALRRLGDHAAEQGASTINEALDRLLQLKVEYGSIVLRVTRPIIRAIDPVDDPASGRRDGSRGDDAGFGAVVVDAVIDGAAAFAGSPIPMAGIARKTYQWVTQPDGSRRKVPIASPAPASPAPAPSAAVPQPRSQQPIAAPASAPAGTQELYAELTTRIRTTIAQLERKLADEAHTMAGALAAATDAFFESMIRTNDVEWEYESLCESSLREIWPDRFDGGIPQLAGDISALQKQARGLTAAAAALNDQRSTLRGP